MLDLYFGFDNGIPKVPFRATFKNCTCCIIKPHVITDGNLGAILEQIATSNHFYVSAIAMFSVKLANAKEFLEVYNGVLPEYEVHFYVLRIIKIYIYIYNERPSWRRTTRVWLKRDSCGFDPPSRECIIIYSCFHFSALTSRQKSGVEFCTSRRIVLKNSEGRGKQSVLTPCSLPTLSRAGYSVKLIFIY